MKDRIVILTGGVGGAKLVLGCARLLPDADITAIVNTGDDFDHLGLRICPDLDTLLYTLSDRANPVLGWGREDESWGFMEAVRSLGGEDWFQLGDRDLALHILRTHRLRAGEPLSAIIRDFAQAWGVGIDVLPMSDSPVATHLLTAEGELPFQRYFVERRCEPAVRAISFRGAAEANACPGVLEAILSPKTRVILIAPSNPFLSIDPIVALADIRAALIAAPAPVVAISPIIGGQAVKGPTAKLMTELGIAIEPLSIARHYAGLLDGLLVDERDGRPALPVESASADTLMVSLADRKRVAAAALALADRIR
jgi:LPPG:FO 2-phospho-L-lactate transferase